MSEQSKPRTFSTTHFYRFLQCRDTSKEQLKKSKHFLWFFISVFRVNNYIEKINSFLRICVCAAGFPSSCYVFVFVITTG